MQNDVCLNAKQRGTAFAYLGVASMLVFSTVTARAQSDLPVASAQPMAAVSTTGGQANGVATMTLHEMVEQKKNALAAQQTAQAAWSNSLPARLGLDARQTERLDSLYDSFALRRMEQEARIVGWQSALQQAQSPTKFDQGKASGLLKSIAGAQENIRDAFLRARGEALEVLTAPQRAGLQAVVVSLRSTPQLIESGALEVRDDQYRQLLLLPVENLLQTPIDTQAGRRLLAEQADGRNGYGVYGGYSPYGYSPFGLYGGYGRPGIGIGIGIGSGFGGYWGRRHRFGG